MIRNLFSLAIVILLALIVTPADAAPVYLDCHLEGGHDWHMTIDETNHEVSYSIPDLEVLERKAAVFGPREVTFDGITVDRVDLHMTRTVEVLGAIRSNRGQCVLVKAPARAF